MTENATLTGSKAAASPLPAFLADCAPTRPFGNVWVYVNSFGAIHTA